MDECSSQRVVSTPGARVSSRILFLPEVQRHQDLVVITPVLLLASSSRSRIRQSRESVEPALFVALTTELDHLDMVARVVDDGFHQLPPDPGISDIGPYIHSQSRPLCLSFRLTDRQSDNPNKTVELNAQKTWDARSLSQNRARG